jgi:hypothetical protein
MGVESSAPSIPAQGGKTCLVIPIARPGEKAPTGFMLVAEVESPRDQLRELRHNTAAMPSPIALRCSLPLRRHPTASIFEGTCAPKWPGGARALAELRGKWHPGADATEFAARVAPARDYDQSLADGNFETRPAELVMTTENGVMRGVSLSLPTPLSIPRFCHNTWNPSAHSLGQPAASFAAYRKMMRACMRDHTGDGEAFREAKSDLRSWYDSHTVSLKKQVVADQRGLAGIAE